MDEKVTFEKLITNVKTYLKEEKNINFITKAYNIALKMHEGQMRKSGDPYVQHPLEVAYLLSTLQAGPQTIAAGLLHDVLEDTMMSREEMILEMGEDVTNIVDGVTKISKLKYMTKEKALATNHQKILLAMAKDIRVVMVKLVDRLHNMRTLEFHRPEKQKIIAKETLDLYAPLAHRLGMYRIKAELEDISLKYISKEQYDQISEAVDTKKSERYNDIDLMMSKITDLLDIHKVQNYQIKGRIKNIYSIYKKIVTKNKTMDDIYDFLALRIIVNTVEDCYRVLGLVHSVWTPLPARFKDYIAVPKPNLYQSLHTTIVGNGGKIFEVQIRTYEMDRTAELGVAAHWAYKESNSSYTPEKEQLEITEKLKWYKDLSTYVEGQKEEDPLDSIIEDIFNANVYVFTPNGDVLDFPQGSMPLDFAYRIHSNIGNTTVGAIVNGKIVPLNYQLKTGDVVSIKTNKSSAGPTVEWLKNCRTSHAKSKIKAFLNKKQHDEFVKKGFDLLEQAAKQINFNLKSIDDKLAKEKLGSNNVRSFEDLCYEVGKGSISPLSSLNKIAGLSDIKLTDEMLLDQYSEGSTKVKKIARNNSGIIVEGLEKAGVRLGNCCQPIKGDRICGYVSKGSGIVVHRIGCPNMLQAEQERLINVYWDNDDIVRNYQVTLKISSLDKRNGVADMINALNSTKASIVSVTSVKNTAGECITKFKLQVNDLDDLNHAIVSLNKISEIYQIERVFK